MRAATSASLVTSVATAIARSPSWAAARSAPASSMSAMTRLAPSSVSRFATANPNPEALPVTTATRPFIPPPLSLLCTSMANDDYRKWLQDLHAERRFGERDRLGTVNYIDAAARSRAVEAVADGTPVSLARPLAPGPSARDDGLPGFKVDVFYTETPAGY